MFTAVKSQYLFIAAILYHQIKKNYLILNLAYI